MDDSSSPALASVFARARYNGIVAGVGPRRNQLLATVYQDAVFDVMRELSALMVSLDWRQGPEVAPELYNGVDLSCVPPGWIVLGAVVNPSEFVWVIAVAPQGAQHDRWTMVYEFGVQLENIGYGSEWVPTGKGAHVLQVRPEEYGTKLLSVALTKRLAAVSVARDLSPEN